MTSASSLPNFRKWDLDCTFDLTFPMSHLKVLEFRASEAIPFDLVISGLIEPDRKDTPTIFRIASERAFDLGAFGTFFFGAHFERKDVSQTREYPSSIYLTQREGKSSLRFIYRGSQAVGVAQIAREAERIVLNSEVGPLNLKVSWDAVKCEINSISADAVELIFELIQKLGSGRIFDYFWDASIVEPDIANKHGFDLYNQVAKSGLRADEYKIFMKLKLLNWTGLEVIRGLCEGETRFPIPFGTFKLGKKKATLAVLTSARNYRLGLQISDLPTQEELAQIEAALGVVFRSNHRVLK